MGAKQLLARLWQSATQRVMSLTFIGMLAGMTVDVLIAAKLGAGEAADALIVALTLPLLIDTITREGTKFSLVPLLVERERVEGPSAAHGFASGLLNLALVVGLGIYAVVMVLAPWAVQLFGPGLAPADQANAATLLRICALMVAVSPAIAAQAVFLNSQKRFNLVALRNAVAPLLVVIIMLLTWSRTDTARWVAIGYSVGFVTYFFGLLAGTRRSGYRHAWRSWPSRADLHVLGQAITWPTLGFAARQLSRVAERAIASLVAVGGVSAYYFAYRLFSAVQSLVGLSIATTGLPDLTRHIIGGARRTVARMLRKRIAVAALLALGAALGILLFHRPMIALIYSRGSFGPEAVAMTSSVLAYLSLGLVFACTKPVLNSALFAKKAYRAIFAYMVAVAVINIGAAWVFAQWMGLVGIAVGVALAEAVSVLILLYLLKKVDISLVSTA